MLNWVDVSNGVPRKNAYTDVLVAVTDGDKATFVASDKYDGYKGRFEAHYYPPGCKTRVYKWARMPFPPLCWD